MGRRWKYRDLVDKLKTLEDDGKRYVVSYDFKGKRSGELPQMFYRHLPRGQEEFDIQRVFKSTLETNFAGLQFLTQLLEDHGASYKTYEIARTITE